MNDGVDEPLALNLCTVPCDSNADCEKWDSDQGKFVCIDHRCTTPDAYRGARCYSDKDCTRDEGTQCVFAGKPDAPTDQGTCSVVCGDRHRPRRRPAAPGVASDTSASGSPSTATGQPKHGCYPGYFGPPYACRSNAECVDNLECLDIGTGRRLCTTRCDNDDACQANRWTAGARRCCVGGVCAPPQTSGQGAVRGGDDVMRRGLPLTPRLGRGRRRARRWGHGGARREDRRAGARDRPTRTPSSRTT